MRMYMVSTGINFALSGDTYDRGSNLYSIQ